MIDNLEGHVIASLIMFASLGLGYIIDRSIAYLELSESHREHCELPSTEDIPNAPNTDSDNLEEEFVPEASVQQPILESEQSKSAPLSLPNNEAIVTSGSKRYSTDYCNKLWPSPRPVNFVKALIKSHYVKIEGRLSHGKAIEILASRAKVKPEQFMNMNPIMYTNRFMPHHYRAAELLGQSINRLEDYIRREQYLATLRKHG